MKVFLAVVGGVIVAVILLIVGCGALVGTSVDQAVKDTQSKNAITAEQFRSINIGDSEQSIIDRFGEPESRQNSETKKVFGEGTDTSSCVYYNKKDGELLDSYQLCFTNGKLDSKNEY